MSQSAKEDSGLNSFSCVYCSMIIFNCPGSARLNFNKIVFTEGRGRKARLLHLHLFIGFQGALECAEFIIILIRDETMCKAPCSRLSSAVWSY